MSELLRPPRLSAGGVVRVVAPAGVFARDRFERGVEVLRGRGYEIRHRPDLFAAERYLAGSDARRREELLEALADPEARAVWAVRGGYGAMRLLPGLDREALRRDPRLLVGFSDVTALHAAFNAAGVATLHGPVLTRMGEEPEDVLERVWDWVEGRVPPPVSFEPRTVRPGRVTAPLVGGNLAVLTRLLGTPFMPPIDDAVLFLEDVGERPYRLDRMLTHLELAGVPERVAAVVVGELTGCEEPDGGWTAEEVVTERLAAWGVPAVLGAPAGHGSRNVPLPFGLPVELDAAAGRLSWDQPLTV